MAESCTSSSRQGPNCRMATNGTRSCDGGASLTRILNGVRFLEYRSLFRIRPEELEFAILPRLCFEGLAMNLRLWSVLSLVAAVVAALQFAPPTPACCPVPPSGKPVVNADQT